jgi:predicted secreted protein
MSMPFALAVYALIWWIGLFAILPLGVRSQLEEGKVVRGSDPGAPSHVPFARIISLNTVVSFVIFGLFYLYWHSDITLDDLSLLP